MRKDKEKANDKKTKNNELEIKVIEPASLASLSDILSDPKNKVVILPLPQIFFTIKEAGLMLKFSRSTIEKALKDGYLESHSLGKRKVFTLEQIKNFAMKIVKGELQDGLFER